MTLFTQWHAEQTEHSPKLHTDLELMAWMSTHEELQLPELPVNETPLFVVTPHAASCKYLHQQSLYSADLFISRGAVCVSREQGWMMSGRLAEWKHFIFYLILVFWPWCITFFYHLSAVWAFKVLTGCCCVDSHFACFVPYSRFDTIKVKLCS